jgi:hypothetical protein
VKATPTAMLSALPFGHIAVGVALTLSRPNPLGHVSGPTLMAEVGPMAVVGPVKATPTAAIGPKKATPTA